MRQYLHDISQPGLYQIFPRRRTHLFFEHSGKIILAQRDSSCDILQRDLPPVVVILYNTGPAGLRLKNVRICIFCVRNL